MHSSTHEKSKLKPRRDTIFHHQTGILKLDNALYQQNYKEIIYSHMLMEEMQSDPLLLRKFQKKPL